MSYLSRVSEEETLQAQSILHEEPEPIEAVTKEFKTKVRKAFESRQRTAEDIRILYSAWPLLKADTLEVYYHDHDHDRGPILLSSRYVLNAIFPKRVKDLRYSLESAYYGFLAAPTDLATQARFTRKYDRMIEHTKNLSLSLKRAALVEHQDMCKDFALLERDTYPRFAFSPKQVEKAADILKSLCRCRNP